MWQPSTGPESGRFAALASHATSAEGLLRRAAAATVVVLSPHLLGGATAESTVAIAAAWWAVAGLWWLSSLRDREGPLRRGMGPVAVFGGAALLLAAAWTVVQALPWPCSWVERLAPTLSVLAQGEMVSAQDRTCWVSWDPGATRLAALRWLGAVAAFVVGWWVAREGSGRRAWRWVAGSAVLVSLSAVAHGVAGLERVYGLYAPVEVQPHLLSPLINTNHLAAYASLGGLLSFAAALEAERGFARLGWSGATLLCVVVLAWTGSRWGGATFLLAIGTSAWAVPRRSRRIRVVGGLVASSVVLGLLVTGSAGFRWLTTRWEGGGLDKLELVELAWRHAREQPLVGVGRGAFGTSFQQVSETYRRYEFAEHLPAQWAAEWGLPVAALLLAALSLTAWAAWRGSPRRWMRAATIAWAAVWVHDLLDFATELAALGSIAVFGWGLLVGELDRRPRRKPVRLRLSRLGVSVAVAALLLAGLAAGAGWAVSAVAGDRWTVVHEAQRTLKERRDPAAALALVRRGLREHPLDPSLHLLGASAALALGLPETGRWINRTLVLAPNWPEAHRLAAVWLAARGRARQGLLHLARAAKVRPATLRKGSCPLVRGLEAEEILRVAPAGEAGLRFVDYLSGCWPGDDPVSRRLDSWLLERGARLPGAWLRVAQRRRAAGDEQGAWEALHQAVRWAGEDVRPLRAAVAWADGEEQGERAARWLREARRRGLSASTIAELEARLAARMGRPEAMRAALVRMRGGSKGDRGAQVASWRLQATLERRLGELEKALEAWERAARLSGAPADWRQVARTAEELGLDIVARRARRRAERGSERESAVSQRAP